MTDILNIGLRRVVGGFQATGTVEAASFGANHGRLEALAYRLGIADPASLVGDFVQYGLDRIESGDLIIRPAISQGKEAA